LYWAGKDKIWGSAVDDYYSFTDQEEGDAYPINRSIGSGPVEDINWLLPTRQLIVGAEGAEIIARSNSIDEPLVPSNFNLKEYSTNGSSAVDPMKVDSLGFFIDRSGQRMFQIEATADIGTSDASEMTILVPDLCYPKIVRTGVQRRPDTRLHLITCDGKAVMVTFDRAEEVKAFWTVETEGLIEDVAVVQGNCGEDLVYYVVARVINGTVVRYLEKWAKARDARGGETNYIADAFQTYSGASTVTMTGLDHLEGKSVVAWGNSKDLGTYTVSGGAITLSEAVTEACIGLTYYAYFISNKLGFATLGPQILGSTNRISEISLILVDTDVLGLEYGTDADHLDPMPTVDEGTATAAGYLWDYYDNDPLPVNGDVGSNTRLHLKATAPRPCTVVAAVVSIQGA
jgi:hypothetical protein